MPRPQARRLCATAPWLGGTLLNSLLAFRRTPSHNKANGACKVRHV
jgi:hypothetical protein